MSLLPRLLSLSRAGRSVDEDFLTEVFAEALRFWPELVTPPQDVRLSSVRTQVYLQPIADHTVASRPDIELNFVSPDGKTEFRIFVESKVDAGGNDGQLARYADHLRVWGDAAPVGMTRQGRLIYLTRHNDARRPPKACGENVQFESMRWHEVYRRTGRLLRELSGDAYLLSELQQLLKAMRIEDNRILTPGDLAAMPRVQPLFEFMRETLSGPVEDAMESVFGYRPRPDRSGFPQLSLYDRYVLLAKFREEVSGVAGFQLNIDPYPSAIVQVEYHASRKSEVQRHMRNYFQPSGGQDASAGRGWEELQLPEAPDFIAVRTYLGLNALIGSEDHAHALQEFFRSRLREVWHFRKATESSLPWHGKIGELVQTSSGN